MKRCRRSKGTKILEIMSQRAATVRPHVANKLAPEK